MLNLKKKRFMDELLDETVFLKPCVFEDTSINQSTNVIDFIHAVSLGSISKMYSVKMCYQVTSRKISSENQDALIIYWNFFQNYFRCKFYSWKTLKRPPEKLEYLCLK